VLHLLLNMKNIIFLAVLFPALILSIYNGESRETGYKVGSVVNGVDRPLTCVPFSECMAYHVKFS
jgi:hypothetical protein